ncbi:MAG: proline--tRNA ligase [bacterium]
MRFSEALINTVKELPAEAEVISHQLMLRAGMIRKLAAGVYIYLPLGYRVIQKIEEIIREEMNRAGALEVHLPVLCSAELWQESGRWSLYGPELMRLRDRHNREFCLGPTHEEVITDLVRREVRSYRQLPLNLYQIQTKFRDEIRPRFGLMRGREFIMKDAYSFDRDNAGADISYQKMKETYQNIFRRCGLVCRAVEADTGAIGGSFSHEFMVLAEAGEDRIASCTRCEYASNVEKATSTLPAEEPVHNSPAWPVMQPVSTPDLSSVQDVAAFLKVAPSQIVKTLLVAADGQVIAVLIRGDQELNEIKLKNLTGAAEIVMATPETVESITGGSAGFSGPVGLTGVRIMADHSVRNLENFVTGANRKDTHFTNVNWGRDCPRPDFFDLRVVQEGDPCPWCQGPLRISQGIEVGHIFKLGTKYSKALKATYLDQNGEEQIIIMGCYGIGVGRTMAASIEQNHDQDGIIWPMPIAPYQVMVLPTDTTDKNIRETAQAIYQELLAAGLEVIIDDREERPGVKFKDSDLLGIPLRITIGSKSLKQNSVEIRIRKTGQVIQVLKDECRQKVRQMVSEMLKV